MENEPRPAPESLPIESLPEEAATMLRRVLDGGAPLEITVGGRHALYIMSAESREREATLLEAMREARILTERFYATAEEDPAIPMEDAVADLRARYGI